MLPNAHHMVTIRLSYDHHMISIWLWYDYHVVIIWSSYEFNMIITWLSYDDHHHMVRFASGVEFVLEAWCCISTALLAMDCKSSLPFLCKSCGSRRVPRVLRVRLLEMVAARVLCPLHGAPEGPPARLCVVLVHACGRAQEGSASNHARQWAKLHTTPFLLSPLGGLWVCFCIL